MADPRAIADKYISRGGGAPTPDKDEYVRDLVTLGNFILWHDERDMHAMVYPKDAFAAMCRLLNVEQHRIREILRPTETP
jgi:hypothetical protein